MDTRLPTDDVLLQQIARSDTCALELLYTRHAQTMYNLILRIVQDHAAADDILHESFWQVWCKAGQYRAGGAPAAWLYRIARNKSLDELRRSKARGRDTEAPFDAETPLRGVACRAPDDAQVLLEQAALRRELRGAIAELPAEQRRCVELAYFDGLTQRQIAELSRTPVGTVKTRLRLALEKLACMLHSAGFEAGDLP